MSALIRINQGEPDGGPDRSVRTTYAYWNTDLDDETLLIEQGFVPLARNLSNLPLPLERRIATIMRTFFEKGTFLGENDVVIINQALTAINHPTITLTDNGVYYQPVLKDKRSPDKRSWEINGESRLAEFGSALDRLPTTPANRLFDFK
jgi:hypothetical protein